MATIRDGGPAVETERNAEGSIVQWAEPGMSLRDYFAAKALAGLVANPETDTSLTCGELAANADLLTRLTPERE